MQRIFFDEIPEFLTTKFTFVTIVPTGAVDEASFMRETFNQWGFDDSINWNAYLDNLCDLTWFEDISSVVMLHEGLPDFKHWERYFDVLIGALYRHETYTLDGHPDYGYPKLFAKFIRNEWEYYLSQANENTKKK